MNKKRKMNGLFKAGFILLMVCIGLLIASIITAYMFEQKYFSSVFSAGGVLLALVGIILVMFSKPKKQKPVEEKENSVDNETDI